jgi:hypothetical protein
VFPDERTVGLRPLPRETHFDLAIHFAQRAGSGSRGFDPLFVLGPLALITMTSRPESATSSRRRQAGSDGRVVPALLRPRVIEDHRRQLGDVAGRHRGTDRPGAQINHPVGMGGLPVERQ